MQEQLHELYQGCCHHHSPLLLAADEPVYDAAKLADLLAKETQRVWKQKGMPKSPNKAITAAYAAIFTDAIEKGYGVDLNNIDYTTPDGEMLKNLQESAYQFSAAKNYTQLRQLTQALIGTDGKLRSFSEFKKEAFRINNEHVVSWLQAEYDTAINSAQMASKWVDIQNSKDTFPYLQFDAIIDGRTSEICKPLDGVIKAVDDPFWSMYYPPNHYRCRSTVKKLTSGKPTPDHSFAVPDKIPPMFRTNMARTGYLFPDAHPYWVGIPDNVYEETIKLYPYDLQFKPIGYDGRLRIHKLYKEGKDHEINLTIASEKVLKGHKVDIMPIIDKKEEIEWRKIIYHDGYDKKNPDLRIDGKLTDVKDPVAPLHDNKISHSISTGAKQCKNVIINLKNSFDEKRLIDIANGKFLNYTKLKSIEFRINGIYIQVNKKN